MITFVGNRNKNSSLFLTNFLNFFKISKTSLYDVTFHVTEHESFWVKDFNGFCNIKFMELVCVNISSSFGKFK